MDQERAFSRYPAVSGRADRRRRRYTTRTNDRRIVWRALAEESQDSLREASDHFLSRSVERILVTSSSSSFSGILRQKKRGDPGVRLVSLVAWRPLVASRIRPTTARRFAIRAAEGHPNVLAVAETSQGPPRTNRRDESQKTNGIQRNGGVVVSCQTRSPINTFVPRQIIDKSYGPTVSRASSVLEREFDSTGRGEPATTHTTRRCIEY